MHISPYHAQWHAHSMPEHQMDHDNSYPVRLVDGSTLVLPLRPLPGGEKAIALLMSNQTGFAVERVLIRLLTDMVRELKPEVIVGVPTMGLAYARPVAENLGFDDYVALGHSRKFWYDSALSQCLTSSTSPDQAKHLYLDPALVERVRGRRVVIMDDVLNTGRTAAAAIRLMQKVQARVAGVAAVLTEGWAWRTELEHTGPDMPGLVHALGHIPMFGRTEAGWRPLADT
ncbi:phosphoribosyltransferase [Komagataeibacter europaeus NBRC 3261]|uniref:Phosphoribosyltransferase n=1 Tax=Komagataeibacter europaeus NBRC 3261 TaxID=1234669 RepID=A0A0D6PW75_KOMEU|nr:phosphoribosyltransferase [Komagataeibacter europaeus]GAN95429.1 phosphoribosyltransferase [Komagataeibacter europaeus NBRC 3261]